MRGSWPRGGVRTQLPVTFRRLAASEFSPTDIPGLALWLDGSDTGTLFQNSDGTTPATTAGDPVGYWGDKSGNGRHATQATAGSRPVVGTVGSKKAVTFNGSTQKLGGSAPVTSLPVTIIAAAKPTVDNILAPIYGQLSGTSATAYLYRRFNDGVLNNRFRLFNDGTGSNNLSSVTLWPQNTAAVVGATVAASSGSHALYFQGLISATTGSTGTLSPAGDYLLAASTAASSANHFGGDYYEVLVYNGILTTSQRQRLERYLASKWGITLAPQVSNADAQDWINRVYANGGTVSSSTAAAVNTLCDSIDSVSGLRACFYRMGIFAGTGLPAALVPLYRGPAYGGTTYGGTTDTNNGPYISDDYSESVGLSKTVSSSKWLDTGLTPGNLPSNATSHVAVYRGAYATFNETFMSTRSGSDIYELAVINTTKHQTLSGGYTSAAPSGADPTTSYSGLLVGSRVSATSLRMYFAGTQIAENTTSTTSGGGIMKWYVGGLNNNSNSTAVSLLGTGKPIKAYSIGYGLTDAQVTAYTNAMNTFQAALGRA